MEDLYEFFVEIYGKVLGGALEIGDWDRPKDLSGRLTMSLAIYYAKEGKELPGKSEFEKKLKSLLGDSMSEEGFQESKGVSGLA